VKRVEHVLREELAESDVGSAEERPRCRPARLPARAPAPLLPVRVVATDEATRHLEVREPPLLASEMELECRLDLRPALLLELLERLLGNLLVLIEDDDASGGVELLAAATDGGNAVLVDLLLGHLLVLFEDDLLHVIQARHVGESERRKRERDDERIHGHDFVAHGPLLLPFRWGLLGVIERTVNYDYSIIYIQ